MRSKKLSLTIGLIVILGIALIFIIKGFAKTGGAGGAGGARVAGVSAAEREKWISSITPVYTPSKNIVMGNFNNAPAVLVDNVPRPLVTGYHGYLFNEWGFVMKKDEAFHKKHLARLANAGVNTYQIGVVVDLPGGDIILDKPPMDGISSNQPDAVFLLWVVFRTKAEFFDKYPQDAVIFDDGTTGVWNSPGHALLNDPNIPRHSFASLNWEREAAQGMVNLAKAISTWEHKDKIIGAVIGVGAVAQGLWWGDYDYEAKSIDYSPVMRQRFVEFLQEKYQTDSALRKAWNDKNITFATVAIPTHKERGVDVPNSVNDIPPNEYDGDFGYFRDPDAGNNQKIVDYYTSMSMELGRRIIYLCRAFKQATDNRMIIGAFYGPIAILGYKQEGQSSFSEMLNSKWVDFWADPWSYQGRWEGEHIFVNAPMGSLVLRNKTYMIEGDLRTSDLKRRELGASKNPWGDLMAFRKSFLRMITNGVYGYWFEMEFDGWFENDKIFQGIKEASEISKIAMSLDRDRNTEIAVIYDGESLFYGAEWLDYIAIARQTIQGLGYMGADYETFATDDISNPELSKYKFFIFPNAFALKEKTRQEIKQYLQKDGNVILWSYGAGLINPDKSPRLSMKHIEELTGIKCGYTAGRKEARMNITKSADITANMPVGTVIGNFLRPVTLGNNPPERPWDAAPLQTNPQIYAEDDKAEVFATFTDTGKPGLVVKEMDGWTSIYAGSVAVPSQVLRNIAKKAKVHQYIDTDDMVYANKSFLGMHLATDGKKQIKLPKKMDVYDMFEKRLIGRDIDTFEVSAPKHSTVMYFMGDYDELSKLLKK